VDSLENSNSRSRVKVDQYVPEQDYICLKWGPGLDEILLKKVDFAFDTIMHLVPSVYARKVLLKKVKWKATRDLKRGIHSSSSLL
jgi:hypothetical protein